MSAVELKFFANTTSVMQSLSNMRGSMKRVGKGVSKESWKGFVSGATAAANAVAKLRTEVTAAGQRMRGMKLSEVFMGAEAFMSLAGRAGQAFAGLMNPSMQMEQLAVGFETLLQSADAAGKHLQALREYAVETPFDIEGVAGASKTLLGFGVSAEKSMTVLRQLGDLSAVTGANLGEMARIYGKVASVGTLDTVAVDMISERGVNMRELIAKRDGISVQQVQKNIEKRRYGVAELDYALKTETSGGGKFFEGAIRQSKTLSGQVAILGDQLYQLKVKLGDEMAAGMREAVQYITAELPAIYEELRPTVGMLAEGLNTVAAHLPEILAAVKRMAQLMVGFAALKGAAAGLLAVRSAGKVASAAVGVLTANVARLGKGLSGAALAGKGLRAVLGGIAKVGLGPIGWALTAAELGMFAWDALKDKLDGGRAQADAAAAPPAPRDYSGKSSAELAEEINWQRVSKDAAFNGRVIAGNTLEERLARRVEMLREYEREMPRLAEAWGKAVDRELAAAVEAAAAKTRKEVEGVSKWAEEYRKMDAARRELLEKHHADMASEADREWRQELQVGDVAGLVASLRDANALLGRPVEWTTPREGVAAMEEARRRAALAGDAAEYHALDENVKSLRLLADRSEAKAKSAARAREEADDALRRARLTLRGDEQGLARMDDRRRAVELAGQYREAGMPAEEAERRAAEVVATERAAAVAAAAPKAAVVAQSKVAVGGGGVSLRLNDAQLELSRKSVKLQEQQASLLTEIRDYFSRRARVESIPVVS